MGTLRESGLLNRQPLEQAECWLAEGCKVVLATVVETWGSAPCPVGSQLAIADSGDFCGSVSGGCVEGDVIAEAASLFGSQESKSLLYGVSDDKAWGVGLTCGGKIRILLTSIESNQS